MPNNKTTNSKKQTFLKLLTTSITLFTIITETSTQAGAASNITQTTSFCNAEKPSDYQSCYSRPASNAYSRCCYLESFSDQNKKMCLEIPAISFTGAPLYSYNDVLYKISCPNTTVKDSLNSCASIVSTGKSDCSVYSTYTESCCFGEDDKKCYWLGAKYQGKTLWAGKNLDCNAGFLKMQNLVYAFVIILVSFGF